MSYRIAPLLLSLLLSRASLARPAPVPRALERRTLVVDGHTRLYYVHRPAGLAGPAPTLLVLHGGGGSAAQIARHAGFGAIADRERFVVVYPDGVNNGWNDGRATAFLQARQDRVDDVAFLRALIDTLTASGAADARRVSVTGVSNGGMMTYRLACDLADRIAAAVPIIASLPTDVAPRCRPSRPVPMLIMNGTADPLVRFDGGVVAHSAARGSTLPVMESVEFWRAANGCPATPVRSQLPDHAPADGMRTDVIGYTACRDGSEVVLYRMNGAGHGLPGHSPAGRSRVARAGTQVTMDFDGSEAAWAFARRFTR